MIRGTRARDPARIEQRLRLRVIGAAFVLVLLVVMGRLVDLALPARPVVTASPPALPAAASLRRADIVDRNGVLVATNYPKYSVFADAAEVLDPGGDATLLAGALRGVDAESLRDKLGSGRRFVWLKRHLSSGEQAAVRRLGLPGVHLRTEWHRIYPQGPLTAHLVGYVGVDNQGLAGVERSFDERLAGAPAADGPLALTIDLGIQEVVRSELLHTARRFQASGATGLVLDIETGSVLALVSLPDFDPNHHQQSSADSRFNRATQGSYELGSLFKLFSVAMALDTGIVQIDDGYDASTPFEIGRHRIRDFHAKRRWLSVAEILAFSSNIGAAKMAAALGAPAQQRYFDALGLLDRHPVRLPEVGKPLIPSPWRPINTVTAAYGHGIAVSPLQAVDAVAEVVCAGPRPPAHVVAEAPPATRDLGVISAETAAQLRWLMWLTVAKGTGKQAAVPGYLVGGKTGSADKPKNGRYVDGGLLASFVAAVPIDRPRYVVLVTVDDPVGDAESYYQAHGGWTAGPTVGRIISRMGPLVGLPRVEPATVNWFQDRLIESEARNGRTQLLEPAFAATSGADWGTVVTGDGGCSCIACSTLG